MRRTNPMLILALLLVAAGAIFILLEKDDTNSIEIPRDDAAHNDIEPIASDTEEEPEENEALVKAWLKKNPSFQLAAEKKYFPPFTGTDGGYCAAIVKI